MIKITEIGIRKIAIKGIGKLFYQDGFPITMSIQTLKEKGVEVSLLHVADELLKHGWSAKTTIAKLKADAEEGINNEVKLTDWETIERFCSSSYEEQREMIFHYLFSCSSNDVRSGIAPLPSLNLFI